MRYPGADLRPEYDARPNPGGQRPDDMATRRVLRHTGGGGERKNELGGRRRVVDRKTPQMDQRRHMHDSTDEAEHAGDNPDDERQHHGQHDIELVVHRRARAVSKGSANPPQAFAWRGSARPRLPLRSKEEHSRYHHQEYTEPNLERAFRDPLGELGADEIRARH